jgi:hypothetical protein
MCLHVLMNCPGAKFSKFQFYISYNSKDCVLADRYTCKMPLTHESRCFPPFFMGLQGRNNLNPLMP